MADVLGKLRSHLAVINLRVLSNVKGQVDISMLFLTFLVFAWCRFLLCFSVLLLEVFIMIKVSLETERPHREKVKLSEARLPALTFDRVFLKSFQNRHGTILQTCRIEQSFKRKFLFLLLAVEKVYLFREREEGILYEA